MKQFVLHGAIAGILMIIPVGLMADQFVTVQKVAVQYGTYGRPYSFYYPYNYQYYTPHVQNYRSSNACHWIYTNGVYVYSCN